MIYLSYNTNLDLSLLFFVENQILIEELYHDPELTYFTSKTRYITSWLKYVIIKL